MIGELVGVRYEILGDIEDSPLFASYRAMDRQSGKEVRVRLLDPAFVSEPAFVRALREHTEKVQQVQHPGLEKITDFVEDEGKVAIVSEYVPSIPLDERVKRLASFSVQLAVSTAVNVCEALSAVHQAGMLHGDVSGRNVLITPSGSVKLAMTGYWTTYPHSSKAGLAMLRGMAHYLAPEVTAGAMPSPATDVYSVGVLIYQMLAGRCPFSGDSTVAIATKHATAPYPSLRNINPSVPEALDELVRKCLSKNPGERYQKIDELLADLRGIQDALRFGRPLSWPLRKEPGEPKPVAPVVQEPEQKVSQQAKVKAKKKREETDGLPGWLVVLVYLTVIAFVGALGGWAWFNTHQPKIIDLPNLVGKSQQEAAKQLRDLGLTMRMSRQMESEKFPAGTVLEQSPAPGRQKIKEQGTVQVVLSSGSRFVEVPDLRGRTVADANNLLAALNLEVNDRLDKVRDRELAEGLIVTQNPGAGRRIERGSKVKVSVSNGDKRVADEGASTDRYLYKLTITMPPGAAPVAVRIDMTDDRETQTIFEEQKEPGEQFLVEHEGFGKEAMFRIFFDEVLVDQITKKATEKAKDQGEQR
ncbi:MAG: PASTA domain-containing protein [Armatimonadetes bacterium]|nr:PASTA domain-containing protein [Armatimonadota bacterium]